MKKSLTVLIFLAVLAFSPKPALASQTAGSSAMLKQSLFDIEPADPRVTQLKRFLESYGSPLAPFAKNFIDSADRYQIDWRLVPAITGVESTFGKRIPFNSFNAYGWANGVYFFNSWEQSIEHVSRVLRQKYFDRGLDDPYRIGPVYAPPSGTWAGKVVFFMNKIDCFEALTLTI